MFAAPRLAVWGALNSTEVLKAAIPGCSRIEWVGEFELEATITVNLGVAHPTFTGELLLSDVMPAERYVLSGKGKGGLLGLAHGSAEITLADAANGGTILEFAAIGGASGRIMKLGRAIIGNSAQAVIDRFFERFAVAMDTSVTPM